MKYNATNKKAVYRPPAPASQALRDQQSRPNTSKVPSWLRDSGIGAWSIIGITIVVGAVVFATSKISAVFIAVFAALVFTALLNPLVNWMSKRMARGLAVTISLLGTILIVAGMLTFVVTSVAGQWHSLARQLSHGVEMIVDFIDKTPFGVTVTTDQAFDWIQSMLEKGQDYLASNWQHLATTALSNVGGVALAITSIALAIFVTVFFLLSGSQMWRWFLNLLPSDVRGKWNHGAQAGWRTFAGYGRGTIIIAFIDGVLAWIVLEVLRIPLSPALAVLVMIGALIPMVGAPAAMVLAMVVALATEGVMKAILVGVFIALIGQLEGHILQPLIMGKQVALHPVVVGIGVMAGTLLAGLLGAIIAIPIIAVIWAVFSSLYRRDPPIVGPLPDSVPIEPPEASAPKKKPGFFGRLWLKIRGNRPKDERDGKSEVVATDVGSASTPKGSSEGSQGAPPHEMEF